MSHIQEYRILEGAGINIPTKESMTPVFSPGCDQVVNKFLYCLDHCTHRHDPRKVSEASPNAGYYATMSSRLLLQCKRRGSRKTIDTKSDA